MHFRSNICSSTWSFVSGSGEMWVPAIHQVHLGHLNIRLALSGMNPPYPLRLLLSSDGFCCNKLSVCVRFESTPTCRPQVLAPGRDTTLRPRNGVPLFFGQVADFHARYAAIHAVSKLFPL